MSANEWCEICRAYVDHGAGGHPGILALNDSAEIIDRLRVELDRAHATIAGLVGAGQELDPWLDQLICYASACAEYEPNAVIKRFRKALANPTEGAAKLLKVLEAFRNGKAHVMHNGTGVVYVTFGYVDHAPKFADALRDMER